VGASDEKAGRGAKVTALLYLDFDGVLHHENVLWHPRRGAYLCAPSKYTLFQHVQLLEECLTPYPNLDIVLSTSWVLQYGYTATAKRLPESLRARCVGATYHSRAMRKTDFREMPRGRQVIEDTMRRAPTAWLAIDDNADGWGAERARVVLTHEHEGLSEPAVLAEFKEKLKGIC
jgi:hypothetical protein